MRQTTEYQSYVGSEGVSSSHGLGPASHSPHHRSGFTLIEVLVAMGILMIVSVAFLRFSITSYQWGSNLVVRSMAQNLAELSAEQITGLSTTNINGMMTSSATSPDFPVNGTTWANDLSGSTVVPVPQPPTAGAVYRKYYIKVPGEFLVTGIRSFFPLSSSETDLPSPTGDISDIGKLDGRSDFTKASGASDLHHEFGSGGSLANVVGDGYTTYRYSAAANVVVEPTQYTDGTWDSSLVLYKGEFPRFLREVTITSLVPGSSPQSDSTQDRYSYQVNIIWVLNGQKQMISVSGERTGDY